MSLRVLSYCCFFFLLLAEESLSLVEVDYPVNGSTVVRPSFRRLAVQIQAHETGSSRTLKFAVQNTTFTGSISISSTGLLDSDEILNGTETRNFDVQVEIRGNNTVSLVFTVCVTSSTVASVFSLSSNSTSIPENSIEGQVVLPIELSLPFCDSSGTRLAVEPPSPIFGFINQLLVVTNSSLLDYEIKSSYRLRLVAPDLDWIPINFASTEVEISVQDVNDNPPIVHNSGVGITVSVRTYVGTPLVCLNITDADAQANGQISLTFMEGNVNGTFGFNLTSRCITLVRVFLREAMFNVTVQVSDGGMPYPQSSIAYVIINSTREETEPMFESSPYVFELHENAQRGQLVGAISATSTIGNTGDISYAVLGYEKFFSWNARDKEIRYGDFLLNFCDLSRYILNATAETSVSISWTNFVVLVVPVTKRLHFQQDSYNFTVFFNVSIGQDVFAVQAIDDQHDGPRESGIVYEMRDSSDTFQIDSATGNVQLAVIPDQTELELVVTARTGSGEMPYCIATASVYVRTVIVNNFSPMFSPMSDHPNEIYESVPVDSEVYHINLTDQDVGRAGNVTVQVLSASRDWLVLSPSGDSLVLSRKLDYEKGDRNMTLTLKASDQGVPVRTAVTTLNFDVVDVNDNMPVFVHGGNVTQQYVVQVYENITVGAMVTVVSAQDVDSGVNGLVTYSLVPTADAIYFDINSTTGVLSFRKRPIRSIQSNFYLNVTAVDHGIPALNSFAGIRVTVLEVNEYLPFIQTSAPGGLLQLPENTTVGTVVVTLNITDRDYEAAGRVSVWITNASTSWLTLSSNKSTLVLAQAVDYESDHRNATVSLTACDGGQPSLCSSYDLHVFLQDVNDNAPLFDRVDPSKYEVEVYENITVDAAVAKVLAHDADSGVNGLVTYSLIPTADAIYFDINSTTGVLSFREHPIRSIQSNFYLNVTAVDHGIPALNSFAGIRVTVLEVNEYPPFIQTSAPGGLLQLSENTTVGTVVVALNITDRDYEAAGRVSVWVANSSSSWLSLSSNKSTLVLAQAVDYESDPHNATVSLRACDGGHPSLCSDYDLLVYLQDINDNAPLFDREDASQYDVQVYENITVGTAVVMVSAHDADSGVNGKVSYHLSSSIDSTHFHINISTGWVTVAASLNREQQEVYTFEVVARDLGTPTLMDKVNVSVVVLEVNDHTPTLQLVRNGTLVNVSENTLVGTAVAFFIVRDDDLGDAGNVSVKLSTPSIGWLSLDPAALTLNVSQSLDYESSLTKNGTVVIKAADHGNPRLSSELVLTVQLVDVNDNAPVFVDQQGLQVTKYNATVNETAMNMTVLTVAAVDADSGDNRIVTYGFNSTGDEKYFNINPGTGDVSVKELPARSIQHIFYLFVTATDHGVPSLTGFAQIVVSVLEVNEYTPFITTSSKSGVLNISENTTVGTVVLTFNVTDRDSGKAGMWSVSIVNASTNWLSLSSNNSLRLAQTVDFEGDSKNASLSLLICDEGHPVLCSVYRLVVYLQDANDNAPEFLPTFGFEWNATLSTYYVVVWENVTVNSTVLIVAARDLDSNENGRVEYSLTGMNDSLYFTIDETSGHVQLALEINRRLKSEYKFGVVARDGGDQRHSTEATVIVELREVNDFQPVFQVLSHVLVKENTASGAVVVNISVADGDLDEAGNISLRIVDSTVPWVMLNAASENLYVSKSPDYEVNDRVGWILLEAEDQGHPPKSSRLNLTIELSDVNEFKPQFANASYNVVVETREPVGKPLLIVKAVDRDKSGNVVTYSLPSDLFIVNSTSGAISAASRLTERSYKLTVSATDSGSPPQTSAVQVMITVERAHTPRFSKLSYETITVDGLTAGSSVLQVTAVDQDGTVNSEMVYRLCCSADFVVNASSGDILTNVTLNYEQKSSYELLVTASIHGALDSLSSNATVTILVAPSEVALHKPFHCSVPIANWIETGNCSSSSLLSIGPDIINVDQGIKIQWHNWSTLTGGISDFTYSIYSLTNDTELQYSTTPVFNHMTTGTASMRSIQTLSARILEGGSYALVLKVTSGSQSSWARRFMLIGDQSKLLPLPKKPIIFESAAFHGRSVWQTTSDGFSVSWFGHFANTLFARKPWLLNHVHIDPNIPDAYDQLGGHRPRDGRETRHGVVQFELAFQITRQRTARAVNEAVDWPLSSPLDESVTINRTLYTGDHIRVWITATDIFGSHANDSADLYVDLSQPKLTNLSVVVMPEPLLQDYTDRNWSVLLADGKTPAVYLHVGVEDHDSGVDYFHWILGSTGEVDRYGSHTQNGSDGCDCTVLGKCSQLWHVYQVVRQEYELTGNRSEYQYSVLAVNCAGLNETHDGNGTVVHQSLTIDWNLNVTSSTSLEVYWSETSGTKMAVAVCDAEVNVTDCMRMTVEPVQTMSALVMSLVKYRQYAVQLQLLDETGAVVTLSSIRLNRTHPDVPDGAPQNLQAVFINSTSVTVSWEPPLKDKQNGIILHYKVVYFDPIKREKSVFTSEQKTIITDLLAFTTYSVQVAAFTVVGSSNLSDAVTVVTKSAGPSQPPTGLNVTVITSQSLTVTWMPLPVAARNGLITRYDVRAVRFGMNRTIGVEGNATSAKLTDLNPFTKYSISVRAINEAGHSDFSVDIIEATDQDRPGVPVVQEAAGQSTSSIRILWNEPIDTNGIILSYEIDFQLDETKVDGKPVFVDDTQRYYVFSELKSDTMYFIRIRANTIKGFGNWSSVVNATTFRQLPDAPQNFTASPRDRNITLSWDPPRGVAPHTYRIIYQKIGGVKKTITNITRTLRVITGLQPYTEYTFEVRGEVQGANSSTIRVWTQESQPSVVRNFTVEPLYNGRSTFASVRLVFREPEVPNGIIGYKVEYMRIVAQEKLTSVIKPERLRFSDFRSYVLSQLHGGTDYLFNIFAFNLNLNLVSKPSETHIEKTNPAVPTAPAAVKVSVQSETALFVAWQPPERPNGDIAGYQIRYQPVAAGRIVFVPTNSSTRQLTLNNLDKNTRYSVMVAAYTDETLGQMSVPKTVKTLGLQDNQHVRITKADVQEDSAQLTWNTVNVTGSLVVLMFDEKFEEVPANRRTFNLNSSSTTYHVTGLNPFTFYGFQLMFEGMNSLVIFNQTLQAAPSVGPHNLTLLGNSHKSNQLGFQWLPLSETKANGIVVSYNVRLWRIRDKGQERLSTRDFVQSRGLGFVQFTGLEPWTNYIVSVAAETKRGIGPYTNLTVATKEAAPEIKMFTLKPVNSTSIEVNWEVQTNGQLIGLSVEYYCSEDYCGSSKSINLLSEVKAEDRIVKKQRTLSKLHEGTQYTVVFEARTIEGVGQQKETNNTNEDKPNAPPGGVTCHADEKKDGTVHVEWSTVPSIHRNGIIVNYTVRYYSTLGSTRISQYKLNEMKRAMGLIHGLPDNATYGFEVAARTRAGLGVFSRRCEVLIVALSKIGFAGRTWLGVIVALIVLVFVTFVVLFLLYRHRHLTGRLTIEGLELSNFIVSRHNPLYYQLDKLQREYPDYEIDRQRIRRIRALGEGNFGEVFLAMASGIIEDDIEMKVAVKSLKSGIADVSDGFFEEMEIMMKFQHENIVRLLAVCTDSEPFYLITEFMEQGDLKEFLISNRSTDQLHFGDQCNMLYQLACALCFLSSKNLVHRDIASRNCLVGAGLQVKLADFGLARGTGNDFYYRKLGGMVPIRWMSPEAIFDGKYSVRSDIWSFGVLIWEVFTFGMQPFYGWSNEEVVEKLRDGWHLALPQNCPETVCEIMEWCWEQDAHQRITAEQLVMLFSRLMRHSSTAMDVPLSSVDGLDSLVRDGRVRQANVYIPETEIFNSEPSRSNGTLLNSKEENNLVVSLDDDDDDDVDDVDDNVDDVDDNVDDVDDNVDDDNDNVDVNDCNEDVGDDDDHEDTPLFLHSVTKATGLVTDPEDYQTASQLPNGTCHAKSNGASYCNHNEDNAIHLHSPRDEDFQGQETPDQALSKAVFSELTAFFDSEM